MLWGNSINPTSEERFLILYIKKINNKINLHQSDKSTFHITDKKNSINGKPKEFYEEDFPSYYNFARLTVMIMEAGLGIWAMPHFSYKPKSKLLVKPCQNLFEVLLSAAVSPH